MQQFVEKISSDHLMTILRECHALEDLEPAFRQGVMMQFHPTGLTAKNKNHYIAIALIWAIDVSSIPVDAFWVLISFVDLGPSASWLSLGDAAVALTIA